MSNDVRLTADDWTDAALDALLADGPAAVAVQPLARRIGASKGSFYWHFGSRDDLLRAALRRWHDAGTEDVIAAVEAASSDPLGKARLLIRRVTTTSAEKTRRILRRVRGPTVMTTTSRAAWSRVVESKSVVIFWKPTCGPSRRPKLFASIWPAGCPPDGATSPACHRCDPHRACASRSHEPIPSHAVGGLE